MEEAPKFEQPSTAEEELKLVEERSKYLLGAYYEQTKKLGIDGLTGLKNRDVFMHELEQALVGVVEKKWEGDNGVSLVFIDLDRFKLVNDTLGHAAGDAVLQAIGSSLRNATRASDVVARFGGEEIAIIMRDTSELDAAEKAEVLRKNIESLPIPGYPDLKISASFGVASSESSTEAALLLQNADRAMYEAKHHGRNRVVTFSTL